PKRSGVEPSLGAFVLLAFELAVSCGWGFPSQNRYKHIRVRFSPAIHGLRHSARGSPTHN
ncbi:hypothetical protein, partial [Marinobacter nauticus]